MLGFRRPRAGTHRPRPGTRHAPADRTGRQSVRAGSIRGGDQKHVPDHRRGGRSRARLSPRRCRSSSRPAAARRHRVDRAASAARLGSAVRRASHRAPRPSTGWSIRRRARRRAASPRTPASSRRSPRSTRLTVEFQLCDPDADVPAEDRVQRLRHPGLRLSRRPTPPTARYLDTAERHRPVQAQGMEQGQPDGLVTRSTATGARRP